MSYLLDTNVVSELVSEQPDGGVVEWVSTVEPEAVYLSVITIGELKRGIEKLRASKRKTSLANWLNSDLLVRFDGQILPIDIAVMLTWGGLVAEAERAGKPMPVMDSLLAATATNAGLALVTRDTDDFQATGLTLVNPWSAV